MDHDQDEAIARALAREEQERADEMYARRLQSSSSLHRPIDLTVGEDTPPGGVIVQGRPVVSHRPPSTSTSSPVNNCPLYHGLDEFLVSYAQRVNCKSCNRTLRRNEKAYGCVVCNYDVCERCYRTDGGNNHAAAVVVMVPPPPTLDLCLRFRHHPKWWWGIRLLHTCVSSQSSLGVVVEFVSKWWSTQGHKLLYCHWRWHES